MTEEDEDADNVQPHRGSDGGSQGDGLDLDPLSEEFDTTIAELVASHMRRIRRKNDMTQDELANASGVPVDSVRNYEIRRRKIPLVAALKICRALGISLDDLRIGTTSAVSVVLTDLHHAPEHAPPPHHTTA